MKRSIWIPLLVVVGSASASPEKAGQSKGVVEDHHGSYTRSIDIEVPAYHGVEPTLSLSYSSSGGNGFVGVGWGLSGFSTIEQRGVNKFAAPFSNLGTTYLLDGNELTRCDQVDPSLPPSSLYHVCSDPALGAGYYHTQIESFQKIQFDSANNKWFVWGKNGIKLEFGGTGNTFPTSAGTYRWLLKRATNLRGKTADYTWECPTSGTLTLDCYPRQVTYGPYTVLLDRETRPDKIAFATGASSGSIVGAHYEGKTTDRLHEVIVKLGTQQIRSYRLAYKYVGTGDFTTATGRSVLERVTQYGKSTDTLPVTTFQYSGANGVSLSAPMTTTVPGNIGCNDPEGESSEPIMSANFNSDSCTDFIWDDNAGDNAFKVYLSKCDGTGQFFAGAPQDFGERYDPPRWKFGDFNGDGITDIAFFSLQDKITYATGEFERIKVYLANGNGTFRGPYNGPYRYVDYTRNANLKNLDFARLMSGDFDGDGDDDLIAFEGCNYAYGMPATISGPEPVDAYDCSGGDWGVNIYWFYPNGNGVSYEHATTGTIAHLLRVDQGIDVAIADMTRIKTGDFNGDGAMDFAIIAVSPTLRRTDPKPVSGEAIKIYLSLRNGNFQPPFPGSGTGPLVPFWYGPYLGLGGVKEDIRVKIADFNGDGMSDLAYIDQPTAIYLGHGNGLFDSMIAGPNINPTVTAEISFSDFNGDGRVDIANLPQGGTPLIYLSTGFGSGSEALAFGHTISAPAFGWCSWTGDFNGDGKSDIALGGASLMRFHYASGDAPDLLTRVDNGYGGAEVITYRPSAGFVTNSPGIPIYQLVRELELSGGQTEGSLITDYDYAGGLYDRLERKFLGFESVTTYLPQRPNDAVRPRSVSHYLLDPRTTPLPKQVEIYDETGALRKLQKNLAVLSDNYPLHYAISSAWDIDLDADHAPLPAAAFDPDKAKLSDMKAWWAKGTIDAKAKRTLKSFAYDTVSDYPITYGGRFGNLLVTFDYGDFDASGDETTTETLYRVNKDLWLVNLPSTVKMYKGEDTGQPLLSRTIYEYDNGVTPVVRGEITRTLKWVSDSPGSGSGNGFRNPDDPLPFIYCAVVTCSDGLVKCVKPLGGYSPCEYTYAQLPPQFDKCEEMTFQGRIYETVGIELSSMPEECGWDGVPLAPLLSPALESTTTADEAIAAEMEKTTVLSRPSIWEKVYDWFNSFLGNGDFPEIQTTTTPHDTVTESGYDADGNLWWQRDELAKQTNIDYDTTYNLLVRKTTLPITTHVTEVMQFDFLCGLPLRTRDPNGIDTVQTYDNFCRPLRKEIHGPSGFTGAFTETRYCNYSGTCGNPTTQYTETRSPGPSGTGDLWTKEYFDGFLRTYKTERKGPATGQNILQDVTYDVRGNPRYRSIPYYTGASPVWESEGFDSFNRSLVLTHPDSSHVSTVYKARSAETTDEIGHIKQEMVETRAAGGRTVTHKHQISASLQTTDIEEYDNYGNLVAVTDSAGAREEYQYDTLGRKRFTISPHTGNWEFIYDDAGRKVEQHDAIRDATYPSGQITKWVYDALGRLRYKGLRFGTADQMVYRNDYDQVRTGFYNIGKKTGTSSLLGTNAYNFDIFGNLVGATRVVDNIAYPMSWAYDITGRLLWTLYPDELSIGNSMTPYTYDAAGRPKTIPGVVGDAQYNAEGKLTQITFWSGVTTTRQYDPNRSWPTSIVTTQSGLTKQQLTYPLYDANGQVRQIRSNVAEQQWNFQYDDLRQVVTATNLGNSAHNQTFVNLTNGNILSNSRIGTYIYDSVQPHAIDSAPGGRSYQYDANGNMTNRSGTVITYDGEGRPTQIGTTLFVYDGDGKRVKKIFGSTKTVYLDDDVEIKNCSVKRYVSFAGSPVSEITLTSQRFLHVDRLGTVQTVTDGAGNILSSPRFFRPYGEESPAYPWDVSLGYTGQRLDETGLIYLHARYYDPEIGRFISPDPLVTTDWPTGINTYQYADNSPVNKTDVTGTEANSVESQRRPAYQQDILQRLTTPPPRTSVVAVTQPDALATTVRQQAKTQGTNGAVTPAGKMGSMDQTGPANQPSSTAGVPGGADASPNLAPATAQADHTAVAVTPPPAAPSPPELRATTPEQLQQAQQQTQDLLRGVVRVYVSNDPRVVQMVRSQEPQFDALVKMAESDPVVGPEFQKQKANWSMVRTVDAVQDALSCLGRGTAKEPWAGAQGPAVPPPQPANYPPGTKPAWHR